MTEGGGRFEILEHTADVGLRATGRTLAGLFENACLGTLEIMGAAGEEGTEETRVTVAAEDEEGLLVDLLNELIYLVDTKGARVAAVRVEAAEPGRATATFGWWPSGEELSGTELKAATYHQIAVERTDGSFVATVYFDV